MIKRLIILILVISGIFFFWKSQKEEVAPSTEETTQVKTETIDTSEETKVDTHKNDPQASSTSLLDRLKKDSEEKKEEAPVIEKKEEAKEVETSKDAPTKMTSSTPAIETSTTSSPSTATKTEVTSNAPVVNIPSRETKIKVYLYEWDIDLSQKAIPSGTVVFEVHNTGNFTHDFAIQGGQNFGKVRPNETRVFSAQLKNGKYALYSERGKDAENNMVEDFVIFE